MESLPSGIEAYLQEAGFSGTEITVLKKLLETDALTLRELAARTGKSTGVLDQAVKKLLKKKIIAREIINETPKYVLRSLNTVLEWMEEDTKLKQQMIVRRHENFESFVRSLTVGKKRPEMEFFEGVEGIKRAYTELLNRGNDIVQYGPTTYLAEEDPLRDFRVQWFRERRNRAIFSRILTHNTVLGRRFKSRDAFEYRKTILVDPDTYPFRFEKIIIGDTVACFQLEENQACFIKFPELAEDERSFFERIWNKKISVDDHTNADKTPPPAQVVVTVPFATRTFSQIREFFLSRRSIATFAVFGLLSAFITYGLYLHNLNLNTKRVQDKALSIAVTGALQFDPDDIEAIRSIEDVHKPQYAKMVYQLNQIRNQNENVRFTYILRSTGEPYIFEFVADADSLDPFAKKDLNRDGLYDESDALSPPGSMYETNPNESYSEVLKGSPIVDRVPSHDQWGVWIAGSAPIKDMQGKVVAVFGVDIDASEIEDLAERSFIPFYYFLGFFILFTFIRLSAFNRSLFNELRDYFSTKKSVIAAVGGLILAVALSVVLHLWHVHANMEREREKILAIALTGSLQFSADELNALQVPEDAEKPLYQSVVERLIRIRSQNEHIKYAYLIRPRPNTTLFSFIADADAPYPPEKRDVNADGVIDGADEGGYPGWPYDVSHIPALREGGYFGPTVTEDFYTDQWGTVLSAYAPIKDGAGFVVGLLAIDVGVDEIRTFSIISFLPLLLYFIAFGAYILFIVPGYKKSLLHQFLTRIWNRKTMTIVAFACMLVYWLTFALYFYTFNLMKDEVGKRMMAIAVTAASRINPNDLEPLRFAGDMKREEYQRVFAQLNEIRDQNPEITYIYTMRETPVEGIWEFIVDADSNHFIPFDTVDFNNDGVLDQVDENVAPGVAYDITFCCKKMAQFAMIKPTVELSMQDQWAATISASAPIFSEGETTSILAVDMNITKIFEQNKIKFLKTILVFQAIFSIFLGSLQFMLKKIDHSNSNI